MIVMSSVGQDAEKRCRPVLFIWSIWFVWLREISQVDQGDLAYLGRTGHRRSVRQKWFL